MLANAPVALTATESAKKLKVGAGESSHVEKKLFQRFGLRPSMYVRGMNGGSEVMRPIYLEADVLEAAKNIQQHDLIRQDEAADLREQNRLLIEQNRMLREKLGVEG